MPEGQHSGSAIHGQDSMAHAKTHDKGSDHQTLSACITHAFSETCFFSVFIIPALLFSRMSGTCIYSDKSKIIFPALLPSPNILTREELDQISVEPK